ncbi:MAG: cyclic nucleotide-binding domain-containing protein [Dehalococcoidia bacterium]
MIDPDREPQLHLLSQSPLFREFGSSELRRVGALISERRFEAGATIAEGGEFGKSLYVIANGLVRIPSMVGTGSSLLMCAPEAFGVSSLVPPHRYLKSAIADTDCHALVIPTQGLLALLEADDSLGRRLFHQVARYLWQRFEEAIADAHGRPIGNYLH